MSVWCYVCCVYRWWEAAHSFSLCQHSPFHRTTCKTSPSYCIPGQVAGAEHIQVKCSSWMIKRSSWRQVFVWKLPSIMPSVPRVELSLLSLFALCDDWQWRSDLLYRTNALLLWCLFCPAHSTAGEVIGLLNDYLFSELPLDIESVRKGATSLHHLKRTLGTACQGLHRSVCLAFMVNDELRVKSKGNLRRPS